MLQASFFNAHVGRTLALSLLRLSFPPTWSVESSESPMLLRDPLRKWKRKVTQLRLTWASSHCFAI